MNHLVGLVLILLVSLAVLSIVVFVAANPTLAMGKSKKSSDSGSSSSSDSKSSDTSSKDSDSDSTDQKATASNPDPDKDGDTSSSSSSSSSSGSGGSSSSIEIVSVSAQQQVPDKDCAFTPTLAKCKPDVAGNCPAGTMRKDNDELGKCLSIHTASTTFKITATVPTQVAGFNNITIKNASDTQQHIIYTAKLHGATTLRINQLFNIHVILGCVDNLLSSPDPYGMVKSNLKSCDDSMVNVIVDHLVGNNQTMINMAREYLKVRGIQ